MPILATVEFALVAIITTADFSAWPRGLLEARRACQGTSSGMGGWGSEDRQLYSGRPAGSTNIGQWT